MRHRTPVLFALACATALSAQTPPARSDTGTRRPLPLNPTRKLAYSATKGSWMSLDVSPDGKTIVFDLLGDLYTLPIEGGKATRLTSGMAMDNMPRFSPDGKRVAYVSDRSGADNVWIITLDMKDTVQLTRSPNTSNILYISPEWTPDGKYVVASRTATASASKLWIYNVDGGSGQSLAATQPGPLKMTGPSMSPDGRYIWYATRQGDWSYNAVLPQYQLAVYDRETGTNTTMSARYGSAFRPRMSHSGKWIAYGSRQETKTGLRLRDTETGEEKWLAYPIQRDDQESRASLDVLPGYAWTPDDQAVVISYGGEIWRVPVSGAAATKIPLSADVALDLGPDVRFTYKVADSATFAAHQIRDVEPSPDGKRVAFTALDRVYLVDVSCAQPAPPTAPARTCAPRRLTDLNVGEFQPTWSPDGSAIAFVTWSDDKGGHVYRASVDGKTKPQQLTRSAALYADPAWAPSGKRIVTIRAAARNLQEAYTGFFGAGQGAQFVWVPATGGETVVIGPTGNRSGLHFGPDTSRIYAYSGEGLVSLRWDGTDVKPIVRVTGGTPGGPGIDDEHRLSGVDLPEPKYPTEPTEPTPPPPPPASLVKISPTGERALAQVGSDIYVVTVPPFSGGAVPAISVASADGAVFPIRKLTDIGGQFPAWSADGKRVLWAIGNALVTYDLDRAKLVDDSIKTAARVRADSIRQAREQPRDTAGAAARDSTRSPAPRAESREPRADSTKAYKPAEQRITVTATRDIPQGTAVLRGARAVTMKGREVIDDADIVIRNNRIVAVGKRGSVDVPADAKVIDVSGKTVIPGFVDTHYHSMWLTPQIHNGQVWQYLATLAYGVTTTRDPQTGQTDILSYQDQVESGSMVGPRVYSTGPGIFGNEAIRSYDQAKNVVKRYSQYYDTKTIKMYMTGNRQVRQWVIMASKELGIMPTLEGGLDFRINMTHAMDGYSGMEHALPIAPLYEDIVRLFNTTGITYSPTLIVSYGGPFGENYFYTRENLRADTKLNRFHPKTELDAKIRRRGTGSGGGSPGPGGWFLDEEYVFPQHAVFVKDLLDAGGRVGVGSHGQLQGLGYQWELQMLASGGAAPHDVLRAATILGAEGIGLDKEIGSLEAGKLADLVVLDRNPLEDIRNANSIRFVMKNGRMYDGNNLDEVYPRQKPLPKFAWQRDGGIGVSAGIR